MKTTILAFGTAAVLAACSTPPPRIAQTESGQPEVVINTTDRNAVKQNLIVRNTALAWTLEQETDNTLLFTKLDASGSTHSVMTQLLLGNSNSTPPKYEARYIFAQTSAGLKLIANVFVSVQMPGGQVNRQPLSDANETFNAFQQQLQRVKNEMEISTQSK